MQGTEAPKKSAYIDDPVVIRGKLEEDIKFHELYHTFQTTGFTSVDPKDLALITSTYKGYSSAMTALIEERLAFIQTKSTDLAYTEINDRVAKGKFKGIFDINIHDHLSAQALEKVTQQDIEAQRTQLIAFEDRCVAKQGFYNDQLSLLREVKNYLQVSLMDNSTLQLNFPASNLASKLPQDAMSKNLFEILVAAKANPTEYQDFVSSLEEAIQEKKGQLIPVLQFSVPKMAPDELKKFGPLEIMERINAEPKKYKDFKTALESTIDDKSGKNYFKLLTELQTCSQIQTCVTSPRDIGLLETLTKSVKGSTPEEIIMGSIIPLEREINAANDFNGKVRDFVKMGIERVDRFEQEHTGIISTLKKQEQGLVSTVDTSSAKPKPIITIAPPSSVTQKISPLQEDVINELKNRKIHEIAVKCLRNNEQQPPKHMEAIQNLFATAKGEAFLELYKLQAFKNTVGLYFPTCEDISKEPKQLKFLQNLIENPDLIKIASDLAKASLKPGKKGEVVAVPSTHFQAIFDSLVALTPQQQQQFITKYNDDPKVINDMLPQSADISQNADKMKYLKHLIQHPNMHKAVFDMIVTIEGKAPEKVNEDFTKKFNTIYENLTAELKTEEMDRFAEYYNTHPDTINNMLPKNKDIAKGLTKGFEHNTQMQLYVRHIIADPEPFQTIFDQAKNQKGIMDRLMQPKISEKFVKAVNTKYPDQALPKPSKPVGKQAQKTPPAATPVTATSAIVTTANKTTVDPQALETFAVQPQRTASVDIGATQLATAPRTVVCFDFDQTIVNGHLHNALGRLGISGMSQLKEDQSNYKDGLIVDGKYVDQALAMNPDYKPDEVIAAAMNPDNYGGLKGKEQLKDAFQKILEQGHEIVITSNSQYPDGIKTVLASQCGFTQEQLDKIVIVCGYPNGGPNDNPLGKNEPLAEVMRIKGITDPKNIMLVDDSGNNITATQTIGIRIIPVSKTIDDTAHLPLLLEEASKMRTEAIANAQVISTPTSAMELRATTASISLLTPTATVVVPVTPVSTVTTGSDSPTLTTDTTGLGTTTVPTSPLASPPTESYETLTQNLMKHKNSLQNNGRFKILSKQDKEQVIDYVILSSARLNDEYFENDAENKLLGEIYVKRFVQAILPTDDRELFLARYNELKTTPFIPEALFNTAFDESKTPSSSISEANAALQESLEPKTLRGRIFKAFTTLLPTAKPKVKFSPDVDTAPPQTLHKPTDPSSKPKKSALKSSSTSKVIPAPLITASVEPQINTSYQYEENDLIALNGKSQITKAEWGAPVLRQSLNKDIMPPLPTNAGEKTLLEVNLGGSHWVGVGIERLADNKLSVVYMDSLDPTAQMPDQTQFTAVLETLGAKKKDISFTTYAHCWGQGANVACGVYAHENLKRWATGAGNEPNPGEAALRKRHVLLLDNPEFTAKQLENRVTVRKVSLREANDLTFSERKQHDDIVTAISKMTNPTRRNEILASFINAQSETKDYFKDIKAAFINIQTNDGYSPEDKAQATEVYKKIFTEADQYLVDPSTLRAVTLTMIPPVRVEDIVLQTEHPLLTAVENADTNEVTNLLKANTPQITAKIITEALKLAMAKIESNPVQPTNLLVIKQALAELLPPKVVAAMTTVAPVTVGAKPPSSTVATPPIELTDTTVGKTGTPPAPSSRARTVSFDDSDLHSTRSSKSSKTDSTRIAALDLASTTVKPQPVTSPAKPVASAAQPITDPLLLAVDTYKLAEVKKLLPSAAPESVQAAKILAQRKIAELNDAPIFQNEKAATKLKKEQLGKLNGITKALDRIEKPLTPEVEVSLSEFSIFDSPASTVSVAPSASPIKVAPTLSNPSIASTTNPLTASTQQSTSLATGGSSTTLRTPVSPSTSTSYTPPTTSSSMPDTTGFDPSQSSYPSAMQSASPSRFQPSRVTHPWDIRDAETEANGGFKAARNVMIACFLLLLIGLMAGGIPLIALAGLAVSGGFMAKYDDDMQTEKRQIAKQRNIQYGISEEPVHYAPVRQPLMPDMPTQTYQPYGKSATYYQDAVKANRTRQQQPDGPATAA